MDNYRHFNLLRVDELTVLRHDWFRPWYEITDGQFTYGKLTYQGWLKRKAILETAGNTWTIIPKGAFSRILYINTPGGIIGEIKPETWNRRINITMHNGFTAIFTTKKILSRVFTFSNDEFGDMFNIDPKVWKFKTPFRITFNQSYLKTIPDIPLHMLVGIYMVLLRQQQAAAAH